jgi:selenocysteine-specific elongation factor
MLIGTAGHIDHGKTTLVKALTGVDADRLPEEKARGITLDLGYAYAPAGDTGDGWLAFVDVPGHEKLIRNMLAGATGIDFVLLVVAADDGPMPQTREHLDLLDLLGLDTGAVALTKAGLVDAGRLAAVREEIASLLAPTALARAPVFAVDSPAGTGIAPLRAHLATAQAAHRGRARRGRFRLAIDRVFSLAGQGTVVTGTAHSGAVSVGETLQLEPLGRPVRVRSLHVQDRAAEGGGAGDRIALALGGEVAKAEIARGMWLVAPGGPQAIARFHGELRVPAAAAALRHLSVVHVHHGADDITGRVALLEGDEAVPGTTVRAEILLDRPTVAARGDRFVLRDASAQRTVGGGRVLDCHPPTRHKRSPQRLALLVALADDDPATALRLMLDASPAGVGLDRYAANWNLGEGELEALCERLTIRVVGQGTSRNGFAPARWAELRVRLIEALEREHERIPDSQGVEHERLRRMTLATLARPAFDALIDELQREGLLARTRAWLHLPEHRASVSQADRDLYASVADLLAASPYNPPRVRDVFRATGIAEETVRQLFKRLARVGTLYRVAHDHYFTASAVADLAAMVAEQCAAAGTTRAATLRDRIGGGRKVAIHILEFFDSVGYTRRVRDEHALREHSAQGDHARQQWLPEPD